MMYKKYVYYSTNWGEFLRSTKWDVNFITPCTVIPKEKLSIVKDIKIERPLCLFPLSKIIRKHYNEGLSLRDVSDKYLKNSK